MKRTKTLRKRAQAVCRVIIFILLPAVAGAADGEEVRTRDGKSLFLIKFYGPNDGTYSDENDRSVRSFTADEKAGIVQAVRYWAEVIRPGMSFLPASLNVGTMMENNADAMSPQLPSGLTAVQAQIQGKAGGVVNSSGAHGVIRTGDMGFEPAYGPLTPVPTGTFRASLPATLIHEVVHAMGMLSTIANLVEDEAGEEGENDKHLVRDAHTRGEREAPRRHSPYLNETVLSLWETGLRDDHGREARPGQAIWCSGCENPDKRPEDVFDIRRDEGRFTGKHVSEVLAGMLEGVPVRMLTEDGEIDDNYLSHSELKNSLLSHQSFSNYMAPMEAELAMVQDLGYSLDRRNFYGHSVYGDNQVIINRNGYFRRNTAGTAYLPGEFSTATLGTGLHIYGRHNTVTQQTDLLTAGEAATGVRIDGSWNTLRIPADTRIMARGVNGYGLLTAWGKEHRIVQLGTVEGNGQGGIGAAFDFGNNTMGKSAGLRGSWIFIDENGERLAPPDELSGSLVRSYDISGALSGTTAALYASWNALVDKVSILRGATLVGDIVSDYLEKDERGVLRTMTLSFGYLKNVDGTASEVPDKNFDFTWDGNIRSSGTASNIVVDVAGGTTTLNGNHLIHSAIVQGGSTLKGNSTWTLPADGVFTNSGTLSPGSSTGVMTINGNWRQTASGTLLMEAGAATHTKLIVNGDAARDGILTLMLQPDYYAGGWQLASRALLDVKGTSTGMFRELKGVTSSPTLTLDVKEEEGKPVFRLNRAADAYSRYADGESDRAVGRALSTIQNRGIKVSDDIASLYRALDFSSGNGSVVRRTLPQISAQAYVLATVNSLGRTRQINSALSSAAHLLPAGEWRSFAVQFGGKALQETQTHMTGYHASGYGMLAGAEKGSERFVGWATGFHVAVSGQQTEARIPLRATARASSFDAGLHARYGDTAHPGAWLSGFLRPGLESGTMKRKVSLPQWQGRPEGSWRGLSLASGLQGGWQVGITENFHAGPFMEISQVWLRTPGHTESGDGALRVGRRHVSALTSTAGVRSHWRGDMGLSLEMKLAAESWLKGRKTGQQASFVGAPGEHFRSEDQVGGRNAFATALSAGYALTADVSLGGGVSTRYTGSGERSVEGNMSVLWRF